jgi:hypothetical protein
MVLISKNNVGAAVLLLFVTIISQSRIFDVLIDTALGRILLIAFILFLSYSNKILGVIGVLFIIIMFNSTSFGMMEGFTKGTNADTPAADAAAADGSHAEAAAANGNGELAKDKLKQIGKNKSATAAEGFDVLGIENNIKRGKQSNSIPIRKENNLDNDVFAYDGSSIFGNFSPW